MSKKEVLTLVGESQRDHAISRVKQLVLTNTGKRPWQVTLSRKTNQRTLDQNALLHKWFGEIAEWNGDTAQSVKEDMIDEFAPLVESKMNPGKMRHKRTSEMDTAEMTEFMDRINALAGTMGIYLSNPDDLGRA